jgi:hypothetical protein
MPIKCKREVLQLQTADPLQLQLVPPLSTLVLFSGFRLARLRLLHFALRGFTRLRQQLCKQVIIIIVGLPGD